MAASADFWRGVVDGDGNIRLYRRQPGQPGEGAPTLRLNIGSRTLLEQLSSFLGRQLDQEPPEVIPAKKGWRLEVYGPTAVAALNLLYGGGGPALWRKKLRAQQILAFRQAYPSGRSGRPASASS